MIRKIMPLIRKERLLGKPFSYFLLLIWIIIGFLAKFALVSQSYRFLIHVLWLSVNFKASSLFTKDRKANSLKLYKSIGLDYRDLIKSRYIYITGYLVKNFILGLVLAMGLGMIRDTGYDPALNFGHIVYILAMTIALNIGLMPAAYQGLLENSKYLILPALYAFINFVFIYFILNRIDKYLNPEQLDRLYFQPTHYIGLMILLAILYFISYFISLKILKDGEI